MSAHHRVASFAGTPTSVLTTHPGATDPGATDPGAAAPGGPVHSPGSRGLAALPSTSPLAPLRALDVTKSYGARVVLDGIDVLAAPGQRVGVVGENGVGKSTLLRILAGIDVPDAGTVDRPRELSYLAQEPWFAETATVETVLADALAPLRGAAEAVEHWSTRLTDDPRAAERYAAALQFAEQHDAWDAERRASVAAARLGLAGLAGNRPVGTLSGGQRSRLALAALIAVRPVCVVLDEPTNHLDDDAMELLEEFLIGLPGVVIAASHDRVFLDRVCTQILDLDPSAFGTDGDGGRRYSINRSAGAGFSDYLRVRSEARRRWERAYLEQQREIAALRGAAAVDTTSIAPGRGPRDNDKFIHAFKGGRVDRTLARRVHDAQRRLSIAERQQLPKPPAPLRFQGSLGAAAGADGGIIVHISDLVVPGRVRVQRLDVTEGEHLLLTGLNGSGKSSLLSVLDGRLRPGRGIVRVSARRVGLLEQDVSFSDPAATARSTFERAAGGNAADTLIGFGLLPPGAIDTSVGALSVGQRRRLALAILVAATPDLLLLDEPTNHISLALATELEQALGASTGTVVVASHDRWLRRRWEGPVQSLSPDEKSVD